MAHARDDRIRIGTLKSSKEADDSSIESLPSPSFRDVHSFVSRGGATLTGYRALFVH